jgi:hypothetical protein
MKKSFPKTVAFVTALLVLTPVCAFAFDLVGSSFKGVVCYIVSLISIITPILFFIAFIFFFWGLSKYILMANNEKELQTGKNYMLWGILALFILVSVQAIVGIVTNEFGFGQGIQTGYPFLPGTGNAGAGCTFNPSVSSGITTDTLQ